MVVWRFKKLTGSKNGKIQKITVQKSAINLINN
jgi:hypothetical protein